MTLQEELEAEAKKYSTASTSLHTAMGVGSGGQEGPCPLLDFHTWYNVVEGLMVLFFGLVFTVGPLLEIFLPTPLHTAAFGKKGMYNKQTENN